MTDPGGETQISGAITAVPPAPRYEDEEAESLGEKLAELYARRDHNPRAKIDDVIESTRRELRRGPRLRAGEFLKDGRYRLIERLGDSANDATWRAWDRNGQRLVVIKEMVGPWVSKKMRVGTFLEAARTLQGIEHAGLARILEANQSRDGFVYLATDHFEKGTLAQGFTGDHIDLLQVIVEVGNALQAAHERELVHARVMPNNIHFDNEGGAHLSDFDLAGEHAQEERGSVYVAPETVERGSRGTPASDVYSLAMCALFGLNGGKLPYTVVRGPEKFIDKLDVADSVKVVLKRAVEWDLEVRYGSVREFVDALLADPDVLELLAARALDLGRHVIASEHYTSLWSKRPERSVEIKRTLGRIYLSMEAWDEAYTCLATALEEAFDPEPMYEWLRAYAQGTGAWRTVADLLWNQARPRKPIQRASMRAELARITEHHLGDAQAASEMWTLVLQDHRLPARGREALEALARLAEARGDWERMVQYSKELLPFLHRDDRAPVQYAIGRALIKHLADESEGLQWIDLAEAGGVQPLDMTTELQDIRARRGQWRRLLGMMRLEADHEEKVHAASRILLRAATVARAVHLDAEAEAVYESLLERAPTHYPALRALARMRDCDGRASAAMEAYERLTSAYDGRAEELEANERAADHTAYARLLVGVGRYDEAITQLEAALGLHPDNVEALRVAAPLYLDLGRLDEGARSLERLYALFRSANTDPARIEAALQRADAAWYRGRLAVAMRWYNTVLESVPDHTEAWWGLAKLSMAARGGHPGADRAPWLSHVPDRYTPQEALARLMMGLFRTPALAAFLARHPLGTGIVDAGGTTSRLACAVVDLLVRYDMVDGSLFDRLRQGYPEWARRIDLVESVWVSGDPSFPTSRSYRWARPALADDFDAEALRTVIGCDEPVRGHLSVDFGTDEHWASLVGTAPPEEPAADAPSEMPLVSDGGLGAVVQFLVGEAVEFTFDSDVDLAEIGAAPDVAWQVDGLDPRHAVLRRVGDGVYLERVGDAIVRVEGDEVDGWRIHGGETVQLGSAIWDVRFRDQPAGDPDENAETGEIDEAEARILVDPVPRPEPDPLDAERPILPPDSDLLSDFEDSERLVEPDPDDLADPPSGRRAGFKKPPEADAPVQAAPIADPEPSSDIPADMEDSELPSVPEPTWEGTDDEDGGLPSEFDVADIEERFVGAKATVEDDPDDEMTLGPDPGDDARGADPDDAAVMEPGLGRRAPTPIPVPTRVDNRFASPDQLVVEAPPVIGESDYDFEEEDTVVKQSPLLGAALRLGPAVERQPVDEDSLGPAGDAPLPQWITHQEPAKPPPRPTMVPVEEEEDPDVPAYFSAASRRMDIGDDDESPSEGFDDDPFAQPAPTTRATRRISAHVEIISGPARGTQVAVTDVITLGRDESCDVYLPADPVLAPLHCRFVQTEEGFLVMDNGSDRGTVVNGTRVSEAILSGGETIMVGSTVVKFQVHHA